MEEFATAEEIKMSGHTVPNILNFGITYRKFENNFLIFGGNSFDKGNFDFQNSLISVNLSSNQLRILSHDFKVVPKRFGHGVSYRSKTDSLIVFGGETSSENFVPSKKRKPQAPLLDDNIYEYSFQTREWKDLNSEITPKPPKMTNFGCLYSGRCDCLIVFGGRLLLENLPSPETPSEDDDFTIYSNQTFVFDFNALKWNKLSYVSNILPKPREDFSFCWRTERREDEIVVFGGSQFSSNLCFSDCWKFFPFKKEWKEVISTGEKPCPRFGHSSVIIESKQSMYVYGGTTFHEMDSEICVILKDLYCLRLNTNVWEKIEIVGSHLPDLTGHRSVCVESSGPMNSITKRRESKYSIFTAGGYSAIDNLGASKTLRFYCIHLHYRIDVPDSNDDDDEIQLGSNGEERVSIKDEYSEEEKRNEEEKRKRKRNQCHYFTKLDEEESKRIVELLQSKSDVFDLRVFYKNVIFSLSKSLVSTEESLFWNPQNQVHLRDIEFKKLTNKLVLHILLGKSVLSKCLDTVFELYVFFGSLNLRKHMILLLQKIYLIRENKKIIFELFYRSMRYLEKIEPMLKFKEPIILKPGRRMQQNCASEVNNGEENLQDISILMKENAKKFKNSLSLFLLNLVLKFYKTEESKKILTFFGMQKYLNLEEFEFLPNHFDHPDFSYIPEEWKQKNFKTYENVFKEHLRELYVNIPDLTNIEIRLKSNSGFSFRGHKLILSIRSSFFHEKLRKCNSTILEIDEIVDPPVMEEFLRFLYCDYVKFVKTENPLKFIFKLLVVSEKLREGRFMEYLFKVVRIYCIEFQKKHQLEVQIFGILKLYLKLSVTSRNKITKIWCSQNGCNLSIQKINYLLLTGKELIARKKAVRNLEKAKTESIKILRVRKREKQEIIEKKDKQISKLIAEENEILRKRKLSELQASQNISQNLGNIFSSHLNLPVRQNISQSFQPPEKKRKLSDSGSSNFRLGQAPLGISSNIGRLPVVRQGLSINVPSSRMGISQYQRMQKSSVPQIGSSALHATRFFIPSRGGVRTSPSLLRFQKGFVPPIPIQKAIYPTYTNLRNSVERTNPIMEKINTPLHSRTSGRKKQVEEKKK